MPRIKSTITAIVFVALCFASVPSDVNADGPLRRWLRGLRTPAVSSYQPTAANYTPNAYNLQPGQCMKTCPQTCSRTVVNYVPYTAYRTVSKRVPVTSYRPVTNSDPCTGCTVTCMKPCTTYTYQVQRVPYTTYRPCYRQETYKVPVTTITNDCSTGACGTYGADCNTCGPVAGMQNPVLAPQQNYAPQPAGPAPQTNTYYESAPGITTGGSYGPTPADQSPTLQGVNPASSQRPILENLNGNGHQQGYQANFQRQKDWSSAPAKINIQETASRSPVRTQWSYSPVRLASYQAPVTNQANSTPTRLTAVQTTRSESKPVYQQSAKRNGWVEVN